MIKRTEEEIKKEIKRIVTDEENFVSDNYGSEAADNGDFQTYYSMYSAGETLKNFAEWLYRENN